MKVFRIFESFFGDSSGVSEEKSLQNLSESKELQRCIDLIHGNFLAVTFLQECESISNAAFYEIERIVFDAKRKLAAGELSKENRSFFTIVINTRLKIKQIILFHKKEDLENRGVKNIGLLEIAEEEGKEAEELYKEIYGKLITPFESVLLKEIQDDYEAAIFFLRKSIYFWQVLPEVDLLKGMYEEKMKRSNTVEYASVFLEWREKIREITKENGTEVLEREFLRIRSKFQTISESIDSDEVRTDEDAFENIRKKLRAIFLGIFLRFSKNRSKIPARNSLK